MKTIVNLRHDHDDLPLLKGTNLKYLWLPARAWHPEEQDLVIFLKVLVDKNNPVFVHCAEGKDRTGYAVATYHIVNQDWSPDEAIQEMTVFHHNPHNPFFYNDKGFLRSLVGVHLQQVRDRVKMMP